MEIRSLVFILLWALPIWASGWLWLPFSRRIFPHLPDGGLAAGRLLLLVLASLPAFWGAALHWIPLTFAPVLLLAFILAVPLWIAFQPATRHEFFDWLASRRRLLLASDLVFWSALAFFVYLRLCQPEIRGQEKPMDSAIIGVLSRTYYLPAENPWFSGTPFTNYYYFGHLMAAILTRAFQTPLPYAYNLLQPVFCAFFVSILWSLAAALTHSCRRGLIVTGIVAFCGNYEPLRQWAFARQADRPFWSLDWWSTSRVIPHTINEYPFFTLALGDAHAHFFALALSALFLCAGYEVYLDSRNAISVSPKSKPRKLQARRFRFLLIGLLLGAFLMTNPWDVPILALLACSFGIAHYWRPVAGSGENFRAVLFQTACRGFCWGVLAVIVALPFLLRFHSPARGILWELWWPGPTFFLFWGHFILLAIIALILHHSRIHFKHQTNPSGNEIRPERDDGQHCFLLCLLIAGTGALLFPFVFTIRGHFDGELRHQDTVFKFGLQAWVLLGLALSVFVVGARHAPVSRIRITWLLAAVVLSVPVVCSWAMFQGRTYKTAATLSLNGAHYLSAGEQKALDWLTQNVRPNERIIEAVGRNADGTPVLAYSDFGRVSALTGIPAFLGWPQHAGFWGAPHKDVEQRWQTVRALYKFHAGQNATSPFLPKQLLSQSQMRRVQSVYLYWGELERAEFGAMTDEPKPPSRLTVKYRSFDADIYALSVPR